ncbi:MAG TPA: O-antigen ligase family protein [Jatrophihabitans sp.]|nr:O-antigen ligase family protein [Jatrophihabitans sp.]
MTAPTVPSPVAPPPLAVPPGARALRRPLTTVVIVLAMSALPLLRPAGPGNTGPADVGLVLAALVTALWLALHGHRVRLPYLWPVLLMIAGGALAALVAGTSGLALLQDAFMFVWAAAVANLAREPRTLGVLTRAWAYSATVWAALLIVGVAAGIPWLAGTTARDGVRASFTLGDPNLAASYFLCSLLVLRACRVPRRRLQRYLCCALVVVALALTLSNGGMLTLLIATELGWVFGVGRRHGLAPAAALASVLVVLSTVAVVSVNFGALSDRAQQSTPLLRDSVGRQGESGGSRSTLVREELRLWFDHDTPLGIGPDQTKVRLARSDAAYSKEAHDDYLAALVERGLLGALGLLLLVGTLAVSARRIARPGALPPGYAAVVPRPELLGALLIAVAVSAGLYETLHFRHVWALFGLVAALALAVRDRGPAG